MRFLGVLNNILQLHVFFILNLLEPQGLLGVLSSEAGDHVDKVSVLLHDALLFVLSLDGCCLLSLGKHFHTVLKVVLLALVFLPNFTVHLYSLALLVLDEVVELFVDRFLELLVVISVLDYPVDSILLLVDLVGVLADNGAVFGDLVSHQLLINAQVINLESSLGVGHVVLHELLIKLISSALKLSNFQFFRGDVSVQILNFEVEHELKLLQFLSLLFEAVDLLLSVADELVLLTNFFI